MIETERLNFSYPKGSPIFLDFNCSFVRGERYSVIGPSGCGKTTLLHLLAGLQLPASGKISIDGIQLTGPRISTGLVLQNCGLLPWATAFNNISIGLKIRRIDRRKITQITGEWLQKLGIVAESSRYPGELSGGQLQRVAIARTLAFNPDLMLMDEPFSALDALTREEMQNLIINLCGETPITIILVTHNIEEAVFLGEKIVILKHPPNANPIIIENPGSGSLEYRKSADFSERCRQVRNLIELSVDSQWPGKATLSKDKL